VPSQSPPHAERRATLGCAAGSAPYLRLSTACDVSIRAEVGFDEHPLYAAIRANTVLPQVALDYRASHVAGHRAWPAVIRQL